MKKNHPSSKNHTPSIILMSTLTIRIEEQLKKKASKRAEKLGISVSFVIKNALKNFVEAKKIVIEEPNIEVLEVTPALQKKMDRIAKILDKL